MPTKADLESQIADDLIRHNSDISGQIRTAINYACKYYEKDRFWFNESYNVSVTLSSSVNFIAFSALPRRYIQIDRIRLLQASTSWVDLYQRDYAWIMSRQDVNLNSSYPMEYCLYGDSIQFDSKATANKTLSIDGLISLGSTGSNSYSISSSVTWFNEGKELIRACAKRDLFTHLIKDTNWAGIMAQAEAIAYSDLKSRTNMRASSRIRPTEF